MKSLDILYLDTQKTFDKVPHCKLIYKKIIGCATNGRVVRLVINGGASEWAFVIGDVR